MKRYFLVMTACLLCTQCMADTIYVDIDAKGLNTGKSWKNAFLSLQNALLAARSGDEIWVAEGTYYPTYQVIPGDPRSASFRLINGVKIYGGFDPGSGVEDFKDRDWISFPCVLSGDIGIKGVSGDNCYHVFYHTPSMALNKTARLDGFVITGGYANGSGGQGYGGGMYNSDCSPGLVNCRFEDNYALDGGAIYNTNGADCAMVNCHFYGNTAGMGGLGGAIFNEDSSPIVNNCVFGMSGLENRAYLGGAIYSVNSGGTILNSVFEKNSAESGGAVYNDNSSITFTGCDFLVNTVVGASFENKGGAIGNFNGSAVAITDCLFDRNIAFSEAHGKGGALYCDATSSATISNSHFSDNYSHNNGGAIYSDGATITADSGTILTGNRALNGSGAAVYSVNSSSVSLTDCTLEENESDKNGGAIYGQASTVNLIGCSLIENQSGLGGGAIAYFNVSSGEIRDCIFTGNTTVVNGEMGGAVYCVQSSPTIKNSIFDRNISHVGGAIAGYFLASPVIENCQLINNTAVHDGGGVFFWDTCRPILRNCIIADNIVHGISPGYGQGGAAIFSDCPEVLFENCTIANNTAPASRRGGIYSLYSTIEIVNSIIWGNSGTPLSNGLDVTYSNVEGGYTGTGNLDFDPLFVDASAGDFHLQTASPCIDAGLNIAVSPVNIFDIDGDERIFDGNGDGIAIVDMGADEVCETIMYVWVDDDYTCGGDNDGHSWGVDAFASIQGGIDAVFPGGTVSVAEGTYYENLTINKPIELRGDGAHRTFIDAGGSGSVISCAGLGPEAWIDGFTITNGAGQDISGGIIAGGGLFLNRSDLTLSNCIITGNTAAYGGGMDNENMSSPTLINCLFVGNTATYGGAMDNFSSSSPVIINCTFVDNTATSGTGSALYSEQNCLPIVTNSIFWGNTESPIHDLDGSTTTVGYSTIEGGWPGSAILDSDPQFLDASGQNFRLHPESACIDAGTNLAVPIRVDTDLDGNPRFAARNCDSNFDVDMGCFEFSRLRIGDFNDDCIINLVDFSILAANWARADSLTDIAPPYRDGIVDFADLGVLVEYWLVEFE